MRYEVTRLQAVVRGRMAQKNFILHLGCCIMIQSFVRGHMARQTAKAFRHEQVVVLSKVELLRETSAAKKIQFFWRVVLDCRKEREAALIIERFFLMVKDEVDREIRRAQRRKNSKKDRRRPDDDETLLEDAWLNAMNDNPDVFSFSGSMSITSSQCQRSTSNDPPVDKVRHRASSPTMNLVMRHDYENETRPGQKKYASKTAPNKSSGESHFFSGRDAAKSNKSKKSRKSSIPTPTSTRSDGRRHGDTRHPVNPLPPSHHKTFHGGDSPSRRSKIPVMNAYADHSSSTDEMLLELGDEYGMI